MAVKLTSKPGKIPAPAGVICMPSHVHCGAGVGEGLGLGEGDGDEEGSLGPVGPVGVGEGGV